MPPIVGVLLISLSLPVGRMTTAYWAPDFSM